MPLSMEVNEQLLSTKSPALRARWRCCSWKGSVRGVERFVPLPLRSAVLYHLVYHRSLGIALNHLCFLHTYLFGVLLLAAAPPGAGGIALCTAAIVCVVVSVVIGGLRLGVVHGVLVTLPLAAAAWCTALALSSHGDRALFVAARATATTTRLLAPADDWVDAAVVLGTSIVLVLLSFALQLIGHCVHERFEAAPQPLHGLIAAPLLEFACIFVRSGAWDLEGVLAEADELRAVQERQNALPRAEKGPAFRN